MAREATRKHRKFFCAVYLNDSEKEALEALMKWVLTDWEKTKGVERPEMIRKVIDHAVSLHASAPRCPECEKRNEKDRASVLQDLGIL